MRLSILATVACLVLLAGCSEPSAVASTAAPSPAPTTAPAERSAPTTSSAPTSATPTSAPSPTIEPAATEEPQNETSAPAPRLRVVAVDWYGAVPTTACVPAGVGSCAYVTFGTNDRINVLTDEPGDVVSFDLTLSWASTGPMADELLFMADRFDSCGDGCWEWEGAAHATGVSPVRVSSEDASGMGTGPFGMFVQWTGLSAGPVFLHASTEFEFHVTGTVTYVG